MNWVAQASPVAGSQPKRPGRLAPTAWLVSVSAVVSYARANESETVSASALLLKPAPCVARSWSGGKVMRAGRESTPSKSATVVRYSVRLSRRSGDRPGYGNATAQSGGGTTWVPPLPVLVVPTPGPGLAVAPPEPACGFAAGESKHPILPPHA